MGVKHLRLGLLGRRVQSDKPWSQPHVLPSAVFWGESPLMPRTRISARDGVEIWYLGAANLSLHPGDAMHYRDNLATGAPRVWVAIRGEAPENVEIVLLTADPYEGEGLAGDPALVVEALPLPPEAIAPLNEFVARYYVEIPFEKRKRKPADPDALSPRAPRILMPDQKWGAKR